MTFREILLIGGENVKTQVQQLNEGVSSERDSLSKCMCGNNPTFSKPKLKKKKKEGTLFEIPNFPSQSTLLFPNAISSRRRGEVTERGGGGLWKYSHENGLFNRTLNSASWWILTLKRLFLISWIIMLVFAPPQRHASYAV